MSEFKITSYADRQSWKLQRSYQSLVRFLINHKCQLSSQQSGMMCLCITSWTTIAIGGALRTTWLYSYIMWSMCLLLWRNNNRRATEKDVADFWITLIFSFSNLFYIVWVCLSILFLHCLTYSVTLNFALTGLYCTVWVCSVWFIFPFSYLFVAFSNYFWIFYVCSVWFIFAFSDLFALSEFALSNLFLHYSVFFEFLFI